MSSHLVLVDTFLPLALAFFYSAENKHTYPYYYQNFHCSYSCTRTHSVLPLTKPLASYHFPLLSLLRYSLPPLHLVCAPSSSFTCHHPRHPPAHHTDSLFTYPQCFERSACSSVPGNLHIFFLFCPPFFPAKQRHRQGLCTHVHICGSCRFSAFVLPNKRCLV